MGTRPEGSWPVLAALRPARVPALSLVALIVLCGTTTSILFHYVMAAYLDRPGPYRTFLFAPKDRFMDFFNVYDHASWFEPGESANMVYSPALHLFMKICTFVPSAVAFAAVESLFVAVLLLVLWRWTTAGFAGDPLVRTLHVAVLALLAYPVLFVLDRGNLEMLVFVLLAAFLWLYYRRRSPWAWLPLGLAIASKYYWVTLLVLFFLDREWRQTAWCCLTAAVTTVGAALAISLTSGYSLGGVFESLFSTLGGHMDSTGALAAASYGHSLWSWVTVVTRWTDYAFFWVPVRQVYILACAVVFLIVLRRLLNRRLDDWQNVTALVACTILLPFESKDYTLIHLLLPLSMFVAVTWRGRRYWTVAALFGLLLVPLDYYYFTFWYWLSTVSVASLIYPVVLVALLVLTLGSPPARASSAEVSGVSPEGP